MVYPDTFSEVLRKVVGKKWGGLVTSMVIVLLMPLVASSAELGADVSVVISANPAIVDSGHEVQFTILVKNNSSVAAQNVVVTNGLPEGLAYAASIPAGQYNQTTGVWTIGTLAAGESASLAINTTATGVAGTNIANTATVTSDNDPQSGNNSDTAMITINPFMCTNGCGGSSGPTTDLAITKTVDNTSPTTGADVAYTITVTNIGSSLARTVTVTDVLPTSTALLMNTPSMGTFNTATGVWTIGDLAIGSSATLTLTVDVTASPCTTVINTATAGTMDLETDPNNNLATATFTVPGSNCGGGGTNGGNVLGDSDTGLGSASPQETDTGLGGAGEEPEARVLGASTALPRTGTPISVYMLAALITLVVSSIFYGRKAAHTIEL
jgi:uncharacterized repeat protein (TIGR01451 family)